MRFSDDRGGERCERRNGRSVGRKLVIHAATWVGAFATVGRLGELSCVVRAAGVHERRTVALSVYGLSLSLECTFLCYEALGTGRCEHQTLAKGFCFILY